MGSVIHLIPVTGDDAPASSLYLADASASSLFIFIVLNSILPSETETDVGTSSPEQHDVYDTTDA